MAVADDISKMECGERLIGTAVERCGRIDGVVAVAGILRERMLFNMSEDEWDAVVATHLRATSPSSGRRPQSCASRRAAER